MPEHESMEFDVVIVGAGPAGLAAAIRLAQLNQQQQKNLEICVIEKGSSVGAHILSGAVLDPISLNELIPDWQKKNAPITVEANQDKFYLLTKKLAIPLPIFKALKNEGNYIISLGKFCQWLALEAESLGVNIFAGFAAHKILYDENDKVIGIQTGDMGVDKNGKATERYQPGIQLFAKQVLLAEGCRGSLSEQIIKKYALRKDCEMQTYGIGVKELWEIDNSKHQAGKVIHTVGWPLPNDTYGGSFIYHFEENKLALGLVVGLDYPNPYLDPFFELQKFKTHPMIRNLLENGRCIGYGARALNEGGWQSIPKLTFPGGMLIGCSAGFVNVAKIKGIHNAMKSGMLAAENIIFSGNLSRAIQNSNIAEELYLTRNIRPSFHHGLFSGLAYAAIDQYLFRGKAPWTLHHRLDHLSLKPIAQCSKIDYPKPDNKITFDKLTQVYLSGTNHNENQPCHLVLKDKDIPIEYNLPQYGAPEQRYCPANVYEIITLNNQPHLQINAPNCVHCKTCDIKDPKQNIVWVTPEGGEGPNYNEM